jgi:hypothetical protein
MCLLGLIIPFKVQGLECILLESLRTKTILANKDMKKSTVVPIPEQWM